MKIRKSFKYEEKIIYDVKKYCCRKMKEVKGTIIYQSSGQISLVLNDYKGDYVSMPIYYCPFCGEKIEYEDT